MRRSFLLLVVVVGLVVGMSACTSFSFPSKGGAGEAPAELIDPSAMVSVPPGKFLMGASQGEPDEFPAHDVEVSGFRIDRTEVTNAEYALCVEARVCRKAAFVDDGDLGRPRHPVVGVTWTDADAFCKWVEKRLPTEAEWEYAARTPSFAVFPWEGRFKPTAVNGRGDVDGYAKTAPVGTFDEGRSGLGIHDMAGNAAEWTADWYEGTYYKKSEAKDPTGPALSTGKRVVRGGSWADSDYRMRSTARADQDPATSRNSVGFRCVKPSKTDE
jgi:sulfatase modifying factor 1